jgi:hypothetical protein
MHFEDAPEAVTGRSSLRFTPDPYPGQYAEAIYPGDRSARWDFSRRTTLRFWMRARNPNIPGFQNAGPVFHLYGDSWSTTLEPVKGGNLYNDLPFSEARETWMPVAIPIAGDPHWTRKDTGAPDLTRVTAVGIALDSWGVDPFTVWIDGLSCE